jgi:hypothetical protein
MNAKWAALPNAAVYLRAGAPLMLALGTSRWQSGRPGLAPWLGTDFPDQGTGPGIYGRDQPAGAGRMRGSAPTPAVREPLPGY